MQEAQIIESKDLEKIKEAVFKYGAVETSIYSTLQNVNSRSEYIAGVSGFLRCRTSSPSSKRAVIILSSSTKKVGVVTTISFISFVKIGLFSKVTN